MVQKGSMHHVPNIVVISRTIAKIWRVLFFKLAAVCHLAFFEIQNFNGCQGYEGQHASPCQISWQLVKSLLRYDDLSIFKITAIKNPKAILDF